MACPFGRKRKGFEFFSWTVRHDIVNISHVNIDTTDLRVNLADAWRVVAIRRLDAEEEVDNAPDRKEYRG